jgi:choline dehydrogenase-like flavoprotein
MQPRETVSTDFCVIGSGAAGAVAAWELARAKMRVLIVEEGGSYRAPDFSFNGMEMVGKLYGEAGMFATATPPFIQIPHGRCVGGTTVVNCGTSFRLRPDYYQHVHGLLTPDEFTPYFEEIEERLEIAPTPPETWARQNHMLEAGAKKLGYSGGPIPRNAPGCRGAGNCNSGCPTGGKWSMERSFIPWALAEGAELIYHLHARRMRPHPRGVSIECTVADDGGGTRPVFIEARDVLVAAGALHSPLLLRRSDLDGLSTHVGQHLSIHPSSGISGEFADKVELWKGAPQTYYVDHFADQGIFFEGVGMPADLAALTVPLHGADHRRFMSRLGHMASIGLMVSDQPVGSVHEILGMTAVAYRLTDEVVQRMHHAFKEGARMMFAAGAERVHVASPGIPAIESLADLETRDFSSVSAHQIHWNAFHPLGTCRIGHSAEDGVVNAGGRVFGQEHVWVCDGSFFPASTQVNPQLSIMANSLRIARQFTMAVR